MLKIDAVLYYYYSVPSPGSLARQRKSHPRSSIHLGLGGFNSRLVGLKSSCSVNPSQPAAGVSSCVSQIVPKYLRSTKYLLEMSIVGCLTAHVKCGGAGMLSI